MVNSSLMSWVCLLPGQGDVSIQLMRVHNREIYSFCVEEILCIWFYVSQADLKLVMQMRLTLNSQTQTPSTGIMGVFHHP